MVKRLIILIIYSFMALLFSGTLALAADDGKIPADIDVIHETYIPVVVKDPKMVMKQDMEDKAKIMNRQMGLLNERYDLSDRPAQGVMMSGGRKAVQEGVRVKAPEGYSLDQLAKMKP